MMKMKAVVYVRVNTDQQEAEKQLEQLWHFAESKGYKVVNAYYEITSGNAHVHNRTVWHMLEDAKDKNFDTVVIRNISRISRKADDALFVLNALDSLGIELVTQQGSAKLTKLEVKL
jgi:DNA invertase Pin-like site-specific DNA recombinase